MYVHEIWLFLENRQAMYNLFCCLEKKLADTLTKVYLDKKILEHKIVADFILLFALRDS